MTTFFIVNLIIIRYIQNIYKHDIFLQGKKIDVSFIKIQGLSFSKF